MNFYIDNLIKVLPVAGFGMLGIFAVTGIIITCIALVSKFTAPKN